LSTLSVILPALNEEKGLGDKSPLAQQLAAILGQSRPCDQLVLQDDGSTDGTLPLIQSILERRGALRPNPGPIHWHIIVQKEPSGINRAFNEAATKATSDWLYLASANDRVLPGAFTAWEKAAATFPEARIAVGSPADRYLGWLPKMGLLTPEQFRQCSKRQYAHGCGTFIRRDAWQQYGGYREDLGSLADFLLYNAISLREGCIYIPDAIARSSYAEQASAHGDVKDMEKRREIADRIDALLAGEFSDLKEAFETTVLGKVMRAGT
jgi:glycosyltransferase involved in cell wall biosynthesis